MQFCPRSPGTTLNRRSSGTRSDSEDVKSGIRRPAQRLWALFSNAQLPRKALPDVDYFRVGHDAPGANALNSQGRLLDPWTPLRQARALPPDDESGTSQD